MAGWCFQSCTPRCPRRGAGREWTPCSSPTRAAEAPPHHGGGGECGQEAVGYKVRLFLKWRLRRAEKGRPQGEVYGSVPQGPTLSRGWRPQPRCGRKRVGLWRVPGQRLLVHESCPKPPAAPPAQPPQAERPMAGSTSGWALSEPSSWVTP